MRAFKDIYFVLLGAAFECFDKTDQPVGKQTICKKGEFTVGKRLGIYVTSDDALEKLLALCRSAKNKGVDISVFLTHIGTRLSRDPAFRELTELADVALCKVGFEANGLTPPVPGLPEKGLASQSWHAEMIYDCDRYLTF